MIRTKVDAKIVNPGDLGNDGNFLAIWQSWQFRQLS
jgi:hypothetical protein